MLDHVNLFAQSLTLLRANQVFGEDDIAFMTAPLFHIAGLGSIAPNFVIGIPTVIHPLGAFNPTELLDAWEKEKATIVFNVPQQWQVICADPSIPERDLHLRIISWGAAPASDTLLQQMFDCFPKATNVAVFGQTEMTPITCALSGEDSQRKLGSVGKPIPTLQYRVVDEDMNDVARGEVGEILSRGPNLMKGYWRKPAETAEAFDGGWFHSGDLVRQDEEGFVWVVDRKKDMIIPGGESIYCAEVENVLAAHPHILEAAVYGRGMRDGARSLSPRSRCTPEKRSLSTSCRDGSGTSSPGSSIPRRSSSSTPCRATPAARSTRSRCAQPTAKRLWSRR